MANLFVWQKNLLHAVQTQDVVVVHGNIRDLYIYREPPYHYEVKFDELITRLLFSQFEQIQIRRYDPYSKAADLSLGEAGVLVVTEAEGFGSTGFNINIEPTIARVLTEMENAGQRRVWMLKYMHNMLPYRSSYSEQESIRLIAFQRMIENVAAPNKLLLCYLSDTQVPIELSQHSHRLAFVKIPLPDFEERTAFWGQLLEAQLVSDLAKLTDGLALTSLRKLVEEAKKLARQRQGEQRQSDLKILTLRDWERTITFFKFGETQDFYLQITPEQLNQAKEFFTGREGIKGQDYAVNKTIAMLWKARTNVSALLRSGPSNAPRGTLFLCGPSGTGKTMLSKKLAKFVFGSEEAFHRIDMSEYQQDYTVSKLIGSPPGYVGYEMGGILTNALLEKPFSVVLFDEIEKAHPRIFDLFLQILSDGRLTDSRGQTVFFSEAIIVFTSNLGTRASEITQLQEAQQSGDLARVHQHFVRCVRNFFRYEISRPELLNRIGNNIVPFNFLDQEDVLVSTVDFYLAGLRDRFNQEHAERRLRLEIDLNKVAKFIVQEHGSAIREFGGRAVINTLDDALLPLLAKRLLMLEMNPSSGPTTLSIDVGVDHGERKLIVRVA